MRLATYQPDIAPTLGSMIRLCACFGVSLDIIEPCGFPLSLKALRRTAMDYADITDMVRHDSWEIFQKSRPIGRLILLTTKAENTLWDFKFKTTDILIMGRESAGVPKEVHNACDAHIKLPMFGQARSLNVAMTAGMAISEALRQTR